MNRRRFLLSALAAPVAVAAASKSQVAIYEGDPVTGAPLVRWYDVSDYTEWTMSSTFRWRYGPTRCLTGWMT